MNLLCYMQHPVWNLLASRSLSSLSIVSEGNTIDYEVKGVVITVCASHLWVLFTTLLLSESNSIENIYGAVSNFCGFFPFHTARNTLNQLQEIGACQNISSSRWFQFIGLLPSSLCFRGSWNNEKPHKPMLASVKFERQMLFSRPPIRILLPD